MYCILISCAARRIYSQYGGRGTAHEGDLVRYVVIMRPVTLPSVRSRVRSLPHWRSPQTKSEICQDRQYASIAIAHGHVGQQGCKERSQACKSGKFKSVNSAQLNHGPHFAGTGEPEPAISQELRISRRAQDIPSEESYSRPSLACGKTHILNYRSNRK